MIRSVPIAILALTTLGVARAAYSLWRNGALDPVLIWWRGATRLTRVLALVFVLTAVAYGSDKLLGGHIGEGLRSVGGAVAALCTNVFNAAEQQTGYAVSEAHTNEIHNLTMPQNAQVAERIARRGAHNDGFWLYDTCTNRLAREGLEVENPVWIHTDGTVTIRSPAPRIPIEELSLCTTYSNITVYAPLQGSYGFLPASRWPDFKPSRIWTAVTDRETRVITWEGALHDRDPAQPVSFQAEFSPDGKVTYRYSPVQTNFSGIGIFRNGASQTFDLQDFQDIQDPSTLQPFNLSTLVLSYIGDLGDGTGDLDNDGLTNWEEVKRHHTDPRDADTDGDGLTDGQEIAAETNPLDFDTDRDGLADAIDQSPLASCGNAYGQSDFWILATFNNSAEIIGLGYTNYIQSVLSGTNEIFHYTLTVTVETLDSEGRALIRVGDQFVVVNELGEYEFLLDVGPEYSIDISPHVGATFAASDERAEITAPMKGKDGMVAVRADGISATPSWMHYVESGESHHFESAIDGATPSVTGEWRWWSDEPGVQILSPTSRATDIVWNWATGDYHDTWATANVMVSCHLGHWAATNTVTLHCGANDTPHLIFGINVPRAFFATNGADVVVSFHSDVPTNGTISVTDTSLASVLEEGPPWNWTLDDGTRDFCVTNRIRAVTPSLMPEDIELTATFTLEGDQPTDVIATTTAVVLEEVVIPSAPESGLVILAGSSVAMEAKCRPQGADLSEAGTDWFFGRRRRDGSHESWQKVATNESGVVYSCLFPTGGIFRIKADVTLAGEHEKTFFMIKARDTLDPPASHYGVGQHDHIGVVTHSWQRQLRLVALSHMGETRFAKAATLPSYYGFTSVKGGSVMPLLRIAFAKQVCLFRQTQPGLDATTHPRQTTGPMGRDLATGFIWRQAMSLSRGRWSAIQILLGQVIVELLTMMAGESRQARTRLIDGTLAFLMEQVASTTERRTMEMIDKRVFLAGIIISSFAFCEGDLFVRPAIEDLRTYCATSNCGDLLFVKSWGFSPAAYSARPFVHAVASVSNHWQEAMADWDYYATNAEHRLLLQNLIGFAGTNTLLGVWDALMDIHVANTNRCSIQCINEFYDAPSSPLEYYVFEHFDIPAVSNRLVRNRGLCVSNVEMRVYFDEILSGEAKAELQIIR